MRLSDLQSKDIVNVIDGKNIGNIIDVRINEANGVIEALFNCRYRYHLRSNSKIIGM